MRSPEMEAVAKELGFWEMEQYGVEKSGMGHV
jgi:hypothetical protein